MSNDNRNTFFQAISRDESVQRAAAGVVVALVVAAAKRALFSNSAG